MKITAISGLLLAATTTVVSAEPTKKETAERVSYTDQQASQTPNESWIELASPTPAKHGRTYVNVDGRYVQLRIDATKPVVKQLRIVFADGKQRVVKAPHRRTFFVDVDPKVISLIVVDSDWRSKGTYTVLGAHGTGVATR
jgi:hypothetical protein